MSFQDASAPRTLGDSAPPVDLVRDALAWFFRWMIDASRQVPSPSAAAWPVTLADVGAPRFVVLRQGGGEGVEVLAALFLQLGAAADFAEAHELLADAVVDHVGVVW